MLSSLRSKLILIFVLLLSVLMLATGFATLTAMKKRQQPAGSANAAGGLKSI